MPPMANLESLPGVAPRLYFGGFMVKVFELNETEKKLVRLILCLSKKDGYCFAGNKFLAAQVGVSIGYISYKLGQLEKRGIIFRKNKRTRNRHIVPYVIQSGEKFLARYVSTPEKNYSVSTHVNDVYHSDPIEAREKLASLYKEIACCLSVT